MINKFISCDVFSEFSGQPFEALGSSDRPTSPTNPPTPATSLQHPESIVSGRLGASEGPLAVSPAPVSDFSSG